MSESDALIKVALLGPPGAGKSTFVSIARDWAGDNNRRVESIVLAHPLYRAQAAVYEIAGRPLDDNDRQDGELLNFLGSHMRKINPAVLQDHFTSELGRIRANSPIGNSRTLVICADARPLDTGFLREDGFRTILISVAPDESKKRRIARGDISLGATDHITEVGLRPDETDLVIQNSGSIAEFTVAVRSLLDVISK